MGFAPKVFSAYSASLRFSAFILIIEIQSGGGFKDAE
jgi:hypothetical protein